MPGTTYLHPLSISVLIIVIFMTIVKKKIKQYLIGGDSSMIKYDPFWKTLKERGESTYTLINKYGISSATIDRMRKEQGITTQKIDDFCKILHCNVEDIIVYVE